MGFLTGIGFSVWGILLTNQGNLLAEQSNSLAEQGVQLANQANENREHIDTLTTIVRELRDQNRQLAENGYLAQKQINFLNTLALSSHKQDSLGILQNQNLQQV